MANTYLTRTPSSTGNRQIFTFSAWVKRSSVTTSDTLFYTGPNAATSGMISLRFTSSGTINVYQTDIGSFITTNRLFRDTSAWYHIVLAIDTTQATPDDRRKLYINGVQETSFSTSTEINRNLSLSVNTSGQLQRIGTYADSSGTLENQFNGSMSHIHLIDGTAYDATAFGEYDANGVWTINTSPSVTYGTNGFFILKDGNSVTDQSGNSNNFTVGGGTLTNTEDNPSNNFCTWNPNYRGTRKDMTLTNGNTFIFEQNSGDSSVSGSIAVSGSGKYYWEQIIAQVNGTNAALIGGMHTTEDYNVTPTDVYSENNTFGLRANGNAYLNGTDLGNFTTADPNGDIFGIGFDVDNGAVYFWRNGTPLNSGNAVITGVDTTKTWICFGIQHGGARLSTSTNWGNGYFQTTAVASAGTNASGNGIFEYDVPTGYTALSTKGLNL